VGALSLGALLTAACGSASPAANSPSPFAGQSSAPSSKTNSSAGGFSATCPTSAQITPVAGIAYPEPQASTSSETVLCGYTDPTSGTNLVIEISPSSGTSASLLKAVTEDQAISQKATAAPVSGIGDAAYIYTRPDARSDPNRVATTELKILAGSKLINVTASQSVAQVEASGRYLMTQ